MSLKINYVNTTTSLPFCEKLKTLFESKINLQCFDEIVGRRYIDLEDIPIFFVSEAEYKKEDDQFMDPLGVYFQYHPYVRRELIMICPEKIMKVAYDFTLKFKPSYSLKEIYELFIMSVIFHELAHMVMSPVDRHGPDRYEYDYIAKFAITDKSYLEKMSHNHMHLKSSNYRVFDWYKVIEETLAEAFVLKHNFSKMEKDLIWQFISIGPNPYNCAPVWKKLNEQQLLYTMNSWRTIKNTRWCNLDKLSEVEHPLQNPKGRLDCLDALATDIKKGVPQKKIDFKLMILKHFKQHISAWQQDNNFLKLEDIYYYLGDTIDIDRAEYGKFNKDYLTHATKKKDWWHKSKALGNLVEYYVKKQKFCIAAKYKEMKIVTHPSQDFYLREYEQLLEFYQYCGNVKGQITTINRAIKGIDNYPDHYKKRNIGVDKRVELEKELSRLSKKQI